MDLIKNFWQKADIKDFENDLFALKKTEKVAWTKKIINTKQTVLAIPTPILRNIAKTIAQGNVCSFLDLQIFSTYESTIVHGMLIAQMDDLILLEKYLRIYVEHVDNWAACDLLKFKVKKHEKEFLILAKKFVQAENLFLRRIGLIILFDLVNETYIMDILSIIDGLKNEKAYYVNMAVAWLLCDCMIKQREQTWLFYQKHDLNPFVTRKFVAKCQDSYRVNSADKAMLKAYLRSKAL